MITGVVDDQGQATVRLALFGPRRRVREIDAILDTGFTGELTLPRALVAALALPFHGLGRALLADGSETLFDIHRAAVEWDGRRRRVWVSIAETEPLIGMRLLAGHELTVQVWPGGEVRISAGEPGPR